MVDIPAHCNNCGHSFYSGYSVEGRNSLVSNCKTQCPKCGSMVDVNAATDNEGNLHLLFARTAFHVLSSQALQPQDLTKFKTCLLKSKTTEKAVKTTEKTEQEKTKFIETIQQELPEFDEITKLLKPTNAGEFYGLLSFLLALVTFMMLMRGSNKEPSPVIINNFYNTKDPENEAYKAAYEQSGIKRKDSCPCGSGKKFKNCHGI
ncbi:SEC-C metal-binding domain-containing protein [Methylobacter sp. YRD-M1]|uniref:SEC-C metal-binding domain-containing protein n=1 Tax=Methylobacter sp. YRD-M1 TaxID=2911520 RepID=UPI00227C0E35|nr:SEC-C metal-binding domain-containing protein [Methylobacter sp. YRD-M1]WAK01274.1 SEC-C domain-containing protein [Methylobacter sp. YRD-M1]